MFYFDTFCCEKCKSDGHTDEVSSLAGTCAFMSPFSCVRVVVMGGANEWLGVYQLLQKPRPQS